jgi:uncharacterized delta-60 repeat protein
VLIDTKRLRQCPTFGPDFVFTKRGNFVHRPQRAMRICEKACMKEKKEANRRGNLLMYAAKFFVTSWFGIATAGLYALVGQPGTLDPAFGSGGLVDTPIGGGDDQANSVAVQIDGKIVLGGFCSNGTNYDFCVARHDTDGSFDITFNGSGKASAAISNGNDYVNKVLVQPDGKILLAGFCDNGGSVAFCAARFNANGSLDPTFDGDGKVVSPFFNGPDYLNTAALQPDGKLLLVGACTFNSKFHFCIARLNADGSTDSSWGGTGWVIHAVGGIYDSATGIAIQSDGKLVLGGICSNGTNDDFCAIRVLANGSLDPSFDADGKVITPVSSNGDDRATSLLLQPDGMIVLAGECQGASNWNFCAFRLQENGAADLDFGFAGRVITPVSTGNNFSRSSALQWDGKIILAGRCAGNVCAVRYNPDGSLDLSFDGDGKLATTYLNFGGGANAVALQSDGKILLAGACTPSIPGSADFCTFRYDGGPFGARRCSQDLDGDGRITEADSVILLRVSLGMTGIEVVAGLSAYTQGAQTRSWSELRTFLVSQCGMSIPP